MARNERNRERISERYKGVDSSELTIIPAKPLIKEWRKEERSGVEKVAMWSR